MRFSAAELSGAVLRSNAEARVERYDDVKPLDAVVRSKTARAAPFDAVVRSKAHDGHPLAPARVERSNNVEPFDAVVRVKTQHVWLLANSLGERFDDAEPSDAVLRFETKDRQRLPQGWGLRAQTCCMRSSDVEPLDAALPSGDKR